MSYLRNAWTIAAWQHEIVEGRIFGRRLLDEPVVFFRKRDGELAAIGGRCPHRFAPLEAGVHLGDSVQCAYHGLQFGADGACVFNPHGNGAIPRSAHVPAWPVVERHLAVWIWMGDPALADPALIPDYSFLSDAKPTARNAGYLHARSNYELLTDNILDLSHVDFLHPTTLGGGAISQARPHVAEEHGKVRVSWEAPNSVPPPFFAPHLPEPEGMADIRHQVTWSAPALMELSIDITSTNMPDGPGVHTRVVHLMTPETATTTHYFFAQTRNYNQDDAEYNAARYKRLVHVFAAEDLPMLEGQQNMMGTTDLWSLSPVLLASDAGAVRARRVLEKLRQAEAAAMITPSTSLPAARETAQGTGAHAA